MAKSALSASMKKRIPALMALVLTLVFLALATTRLDLADKTFLTSLEYRWIDAEDQKSLGRLGSARTLRRDTMANLVSKLSIGAPKAIGFDILYPEADTT